MDEFINQQQYADALNFMTTNITPENLVEENLFYTIKLQLDKGIAGIDTLTTRETDTLMAIAYTSPSESGPGVHYARAMLGLEVNDPKLLLRMATPLHNENIENYSLFPNPSNGLVQIPNQGDAYILVTDLTGRTIKSVRNQNTLNLEQFENGAYFIMIKLISGKVLYSKIVLNK